VKSTQKTRLANVQQLAYPLTYSAYFWFSDTEAIKRNFFTDSVWQTGKSASPQPLISSP